MAERSVKFLEAMAMAASAEKSLEDMDARDVKFPEDMDMVASAEKFQEDMDMEENKLSAVKNLTYFIIRVLVFVDLYIISHKIQKPHNLLVPNWSLLLICFMTVSFDQINNFIP